jgi:hypothetical protein
MVVTPLAESPKATARPAAAIPLKIPPYTASVFGSLETAFHSQYCTRLFLLGALTQCHYPHDEEF